MPHTLLALIVITAAFLKHGDLSVLSFHATKVFNTFEADAIVCPDEKTKNSH